MSITVWIELKETSQPLVYEATNAYQKGDLYCVYVPRENRVYKIPLANIWRVTEEYHARAEPERPGTPQQFEQYVHHNERVWVRSDLKGQHREHCLCYSCHGFHPGTARNCTLAQELYEFDVKHGVTTPVWECPLFVAAEKG